MKKFKPTPKQLKIIKKYWAKLQDELDRHLATVRILETKMGDETKIEGIEFFFNDGYCGVGNFKRTMELIDCTELEK